MEWEEAELLPSSSKDGKEADPVPHRNFPTRLEEVEEDQEEMEDLHDHQMAMEILEVAVGGEEADIQPKETPETFPFQEEKLSIYMLIKY